MFENDGARDCLNSMGQTSENVAEQFHVSREAQDKFGFESQEKAAKAVKEGRFNKEIVPVTTEFLTPEGETKVITVTKDDGIRPTTLEALTK